MTRLVISAAARRDIRQALDHSARRWGAGQRERYRALIGDGLKALLDAMDLERVLARAR
jgi:plasmid stabilization system protein ParE